MIEQSFHRNQDYSIDEIKSNSIECDPPTQYTETIYLIARANDGQEYWFVANGDAWRVHHTWSSYILIKK